MTSQLTRETAADVYSDAVSEMRGILVTIASCLAVEDEVEALSAQLDRLDAAGALLIQRQDDSPPPQERVQSMAKTVVDALPIADICQDQELFGLLMGCIVRELMDSAAQCQHARRRKRQADGIAAAKARGVQFGRQKAPIPPNFEAVRQAWRSGQFPLQDAAQRCGMSRSRFYRTAVQTEQAHAKAVPPVARNGSRSDPAVSTAL